MSETEWEKYIEEYEKEYAVHIKEIKDDIPFIMELFEKFDGKIYEATRIFELMLNLKNKIENELCDFLNKEQITLLNRWTTCEDIILNNTIEKAFIYGYSLAQSLDKECKKIMSRN